MCSKPAHPDVAQHDTLPCMFLTEQKLLECSSVKQSVVEKTFLLSSVNALCANAAAVDGQPLVKVNGHVKYTVAFTAGTSPYPSDTTFTLNLGTLTAVAGTTKCTAGAVTITPGAPISDTSVIYGKDWTCSFEVQVLESHRLAGQISPFDVTMVFSTSDPLVNAFYIPKTTTEVVYVYTGATLSYGSFAVDKTNSAYFSSKCLVAM